MHFTSALRVIFSSLFMLILLSSNAQKSMSNGQETSMTMELLKYHDIKKLKIDYDALSMEGKPEDGLYTYLEALDLALESFLSDDLNPGSPLALVPTKMESYKGNVSKPDQHKAKLIELINRSGSLCMPDLEGSSENCTYAEEGEDIEDNWIFLLRIPLLSNHDFWAIIPKDGKEEVYNYGFKPER